MVLLCFSRGLDTGWVRQVLLVVQGVRRQQCMPVPGEWYRCAMPVCDGEGYLSGACFE